MADPQSVTIQLPKGYESYTPSAPSQPSPIQLNPSGVKLPLGYESYLPQTRGSAETAAPYVGRLAANSLPMAGSAAFGPLGTGGGVAIKQLMQRLAPNLFGQSEDPAWDTIQNLTLNDAVPGILGAVSSPVKTITKAITGGGGLGAVLRKFPAVREGTVKELSRQLLGKFGAQPESQILDGAANSAGSNFDNSMERVRTSMEGNPNVPETPLTSVENAYTPVKPNLLPLPAEPAALPKPQLFSKPGTNGKTLSDQSQSALDNWNAANKQAQQTYKKNLSDTISKNKQLQADADLTNKTNTQRRAAYETQLSNQQSTAQNTSKNMLQGGDIFPPHIESQIQNINDLYGDKTIGDALLKLRGQTGDLTKSQSYKDITRRVLGDITGVQNFKVLAGPEATEQLALNKLLNTNSSAIDGKSILGELTGKNVEIYKEALSPETYDNFKQLLGELTTQQQRGTADKLLNWAGGKLKFMAPLALAHGTMPTGAGILGTLSLTNSFLAKAMSNPETANLVVEAMRTSANSPKAALISHALAGVFQASNSAAGNLFRGAADLATVPDK